MECVQLSLSFFATGRERTIVIGAHYVQDDEDTPHGKPRPFFIKTADADNEC